MAYSIYNIQKCYVDAESTFATHDGDFSGSGVQIKPKEIIGTDSIGKDMIRNYRVLTDRSDVVTAVPGADMVKFSIGHVLAGATRSTGDVTEDGLSTWLENIFGARDESVSDVCDTGTTATNLVLTSSGSYAVNDLVIVGGECRIVTAVNGITDITVAPALSSVPVATTVISNVEWFQRPTSAALTSQSIYMEGDDTELKFLNKGCVCLGFTLDAFKSNEALFFTAEFEGADYLDGADLPSIVAPSTVAPNTPITASTGDGVALNDATPALWTPCSGELSVEGFLKNIHLVNSGGTNGKCGVISLMPEDGERKCSMTLYQDGTMSKLKSLVGTETQIVVQAGNELGSIVGVAIPSAYVAEYPKTSDLDSVNAIVVTFDISIAKLLRG